MRKNIDIPEEDGTLERLQILAIKEKVTIKIYMQNILIDHAQPHE